MRETCGARAPQDAAHWEKQEESLRRELAFKYKRLMDEQRTKWKRLLDVQQSQQCSALEQHSSMLDCRFQQELVEWSAELTSRITREHEARIAALRAQHLDDEREQSSIGGARGDGGSRRLARS